VALRSGPPLPNDPVSWWRNSYERDRIAFERAHGRQAESLFELTIWLSRIPIRAELKKK